MVVFHMLLVKNLPSQMSDCKKLTNQFDLISGHFTQVVWKGTKEVGFGHAKSNSGSVFVVANYFPAGNMQGEFRRNVSPLNS